MNLLLRKKENDEIVHFCNASHILLTPDYDRVRNRRQDKRNQFKPKSKVNDQLLDVPHPTCELLTKRDTKQSGQHAARHKHRTIQNQLQRLGFPLPKEQALHNPLHVLFPVQDFRGVAVAREDFSAENLLQKAVQAFGQRKKR
jgi:hypothetical protein